MAVVDGHLDCLCQNITSLVVQQTKIQLSIGWLCVSV